MKATAIIVSHRKEKDVDIYTATRGPYELEIVNVGGMELASTYENTDKGKITWYHPYRAEIYEPLRQAINKFKKQATMKKYFIDFYLDYTNNYLTVEKIAEHNGLTVTEAKALIKAGKKYHEKNANSKLK